jgi:methionyl-tRNA formyltransferase
MSAHLPKIIFMGYGKGLKLICEAAKNNCDILGVFTQNKAFYNNNKDYFEDLEKYGLYDNIVDYCEEENIDCLRSTSVGDAEVIEWFVEKKPDLIICYSLWEVVKEPFLSNFSNIFNIHGSNIPNLMGRAPQSWAILNGFKEIGWSIHKMTKIVDQGDIAKGVSIPITESDIPLTILMKQLEILPGLFIDFIDDFSKDAIKYKKPNFEKGNYWPRLNTEIDGQINWEMPSIKLRRTIRAFSRPFKGAWCFFGKNRVRVLESLKCKTDFLPTKPGIVYKIDNSGCYITTGDGSIIISKIEIDNKEMRASNLLKLGDTLN